MGLGQWLRPPRRALTVFIAMTIALAVALGVAAWWLVAQERDVERQRAQVRLGRDVELVTVSLRNWLNEIDLTLAALASRPDAVTDAAVRPPEAATGSDSVIVVMDQSTVRAWPENRLAYLPNAPDRRPDAVLAARATALLNEALQHRNQGRAAASLAVYERLERIDAPALNGAPAELVARHARGVVFDQLGRTEDLAREAESLLTSLRQRPGQLSAGTYIYYAGEARRWLEHSKRLPAVALTNHREALAGVVAQIWDDRQRGTVDAATLPSSNRRIRWVDPHPLVVVSRADGRHTVAFVGGVGAINEALRKSAAGGADLASIELALTDETGALLFGQMPVGPVDRVVKTADEAGLPWAIYAARAPGASTADGGSFRRRAMVAGAVLAGICVLIGGWFTARAMHRELEVARLQSSFVAAVSHEFRTPLAAFEQLTELLVDGRVANDADRDEYYRRLHRESRRLRRLVEDLLDFRRMEAGAREYRVESTDLSTLVRDVVEEFRAENVDRGARVALQSVPGMTMMEADKAAIARALWNLLDNAAKYAPGAEIRVALKNDRGRARLTVSDSGPGIPRDRHQDIFRKFVRANGAANASIAGTGLGLAMVRHIAEGHGGRVTLEGESGQGAAFTIELPITLGREAAT